MILGGHTITVVRPPQRGPDGDPLPGTGTRVDVDGCSVQPRASAGMQSSTEHTDSRDTVTTSRIAFIPAGVDIRATDTVEFGGDTYAVDGDPGDWDDMAGVPDHLEVVLRRVTG